MAGGVFGVFGVCLALLGVVAALPSSPGDDAAAVADDLPQQNVTAHPSSHGEESATAVANHLIRENLTFVDLPRLTYSQAVQVGGQAVRGPIVTCLHLRQPNYRKSPGFALPAYPDRTRLVYVVPVIVGEQPLYLQPDTGSAPTYVLGPAVSAYKRKGRPPFMGRFSPIYGATFSVTYASGDSAEGDVGLSSVLLQGARAGFAPQSAVPVSLLLQQVVVNRAKTVKEQSIMDGLLGLSYGNTDGRPLPNRLLHCLMSSLQTPVFAASLPPAGLGAFHFGYVDSTKFRPPLRFVEVDASKGHWQFQSPGALVADTVFNGPAPTIVDTGSSLLRLYPNAVNYYYSKVPGRRYNKVWGGYYFPCNAPLPPLQVGLVGTYSAYITPQMLRGPVLFGNYCLGGLQATEDSVQSLGVVFLRSQYVVYDYGTQGRPRLGFAPHA